MAIYEGIVHVLHPRETIGAVWNYSVLGIAFIFESVSWIIAAREFIREKKKLSWWSAFHASKDPSVYTVLAEDTAALAGLIIAAAGTAASELLHWPQADGLASMLIGVLLSSVSLFLLAESKGLLIGESTDREVIRGVNDIIHRDPSVERIKAPLTMHLGPDEVLLTMEMQFRSKITAVQAAQVIDRLESNIRKTYPQIRHIYIEAASLKSRE